MRSAVLRSHLNELKYIEFSAYPISIRDVPAIKVPVTSIVRAPYFGTCNENVFHVTRRIGLVLMSSLDFS